MKIRKIQKDIVVIGAGVSGLMFASLHPQEDFAIVESNSKIGQKIKVSGGGKCNITNRNISYKNYLGDREFVQKVLGKFTYHDVLDFFEGIEFVKRKKEQFFCKNSSQDIVEFFKTKIASHKIYLNQTVLDVSYHDKKFITKTKDSIFISNKLIVASGGLSFKELGASGIAFEIAKKFGHSIKTTKPALVGLTLQKEDFWMKELSGVSLPVKIKVADKVFEDNLLFTHRGISGPAVLNSSLYWEKGSLEIDFLPYHDIKLSKKEKQISSNLPLPKRFVKEFLHYLVLKDKVVAKLTKEEIKKLNILKSYKLAPSGNFGYNKAEVTKGGIRIDDINPHTMESELQKNLYFLGECLDITGELGGYNIHFAIASSRRYT